MTYWICEARSRDRLREDVQHHIDKGWRPHGGLAVVQSQSSAEWWYFQAMVIGEPHDNHAERRRDERPDRPSPHPLD